MKGYLSVFTGVSEVYSVNGTFDLVVIVKLNSGEEPVSPVTDEMGSVAGIARPWSHLIVTVVAI
ncbi:hypothetical protein [Desulfosediminicola sp.]|uniref:hypothetical protein n=1 Tax=Desulfosediminicola sp. TaxID=2886825 RepID=UPI003AF2289F